MTRTITMTTLTLVLAACGAPTKPATIENTGSEALEQPAQAGAGFRDGALWSCQISDYDPQPCKLSQTADGWQLTKLLGSQRFTGSLTPVGKALAFDGEFFCPWGDCTTPMQVEFQPDGEAAYAAEFGGDQVHLRYDDALANEYGGAGYGGLTGREQ